MFRFYKIYLTLLLYLTHFNFLPAQNQEVNDELYKNLRFTNFVIPNFPTDIKSVAQDSNGFMWFSAYGYGVMRYDGTNFKQYVSDYLNPNSLSSDYVNDIFTDSKGLTWFATRNGLAVYDEEHDSFRQVLRGGLFYKQIGNLITLTEDKLGNIVAECQNGILYVYIDRDKISASDYKIYGLKIDNTRYSTIQMICVDEYNNIIATTPEGNFLKRADDTAFLSYQFGFENDNNRFQAFDESCNCFTSTSRTVSIYKYDSLTYSYVNTLKKYDWTQGRKWSTPSTPYQYKDGVNFMHTRNGLDILIYSNDYKTIRGYFHYQNLPENINTLQNNIIHDICFDKNENIWVSTPGGISFYEPSGISFQYYTLADFSTNFSYISVRSFYQKGRNIVWVGSINRGLFLLDIKHNKIIEIPESIVPKFRNIDWITSTGKNNIWFSVSDDNVNGIFKLDFPKGFHKTGDFSKLKLSQLQLTNIGFHTEFEKPATYVNYDSKGNFWVGGYEIGLLRFAVENGEPVKLLGHYYNESDNPDYKIEHNSVHDMWERKGGGYLLATRARGFCVIDSNYKVDTIFANAALDIPRNVARVNMVFEDNNENIWAATSEWGFVRMDKNYGNKKIYTIENGLLSNNALNIMQDNFNNIWVNTNRGVSRLNNDNETFISVNTSYDGKAKPYFGPYYKDKAGSLYYVYSGQGIVKINFHDSTVYSHSKPLIVFTDLHINNKLVTVNDTANSILEKSLNLTESIKLKYFQNNVTIGFASLSYPSSKNCYYRYKLEGVDEEWIETKHPFNYANYSKLPGGDYVFKLHATNNKGVWSKTPRKLNLHIDLIFYKTGWFRTLLVTCFVFITMVIYFLRVNAIRLRNKQLEELVDKRTKEIKDKNNQLLEQANELQEINALLEERQQQVEEQAEEMRTLAEELMVQKDNLELNINTKNTLFTIIAHDIKNPFNTLLGFSEVLKLKSATAPREKINKYIDIVHNSSKSIYRLLENLLQWSRAQLGSITLEYQKIQLMKIVDEIRDILAEPFEEKNNVLVTSFNDDVEIITDYNVLNSILRNLINNANKFTSNGTITIGFEQGRNKNIIKVSDTGVGIAEEIRKQLFVITKGRTQKGTSGESGTGLGLIVCKDFVKLLKGTIEVESELGKGSTFTITLPQATIST